MSSEVIGFPCANGEFGACSAAEVRHILAQHLRDPEFALRESFLLRLPGDEGWYDAHVSIEGDSVLAVTIYRPDHSLDLWALLLDLSDKCNMLLVGSALGQAGCLAANQQIAEAMPPATREAFGTPIVARDPRTAIAAICVSTNH